MNKTFLKRICAVLTAAAVVFVCQTTALAQPEVPEAAAEPLAADVGQANADIFLPEYSEYLEAQGEAAVYTGDGIVLDGASASVDGGGIAETFEGRSGVAMPEVNGRVSWTLPEGITDGLYALKLTYASGMDNGSEYQIKVFVNGRELNRQASLITLSKLWIQPENYASLPERRFELDQFGNELSSIQEETQGWQDAVFADSEGKYTGALLFRLKAGDRLTLVCRRSAIAVDQLALTAEPVLQGYDHIRSEISAILPELNGEAITVQAELPLYTSDSSLLSTSDHMSAATQPQDSMHTLQNTIGQTFWQYAGQTITWQFSVPESGLYKIDLRYRQNYQRGVRVGRRIRIDGDVPFAELDKYVFAFSDSWRIEELGNGTEPYMFFLEKGPHTISMEVVLAYPELIRKMEAEMKELNAFYRQVLMIVGSDPDPYRDYMLDTAIPGFRDEIKNREERLRARLSELYADGFEKGGSIVVAEEVADMLTEFIKKPDDVPMRLSAFSDALAGLGSWLSELGNQPLELDYIAFVPSKEAKLTSGSGFFRDAAYGFEVFLASFFADYSSISSTGGKGALNVWVNTGRDQAQVIKRLVMNRFIPEYDTPVNISLVLQGLIPATLSGKGPDIVIGLSSTDAVNLAVRGALTDLKQFSGDGGKTASFDEVTGWFQPTSLDLYTYQDTVYALPVEEQFNMLFVRTDILEGLNLTVPRTWDELNNTVSILARNYLEVGIPTNPGAGLTSAQSGAGAVNESVFQTLLFQLGGSYYVDGWAGTGFDSEAAISAFIRWTEYFTKYTLPTDYDLFSRFRSGQMPMAMVSYIFYNILSAGAPEIRGLWEMAPIPGTVKEDGSLDRSVAGGSSAIAMFGKTAEKDRAWSFLQWYVNTETQTSYSKQIESILGPSGRYDPANIEALKQIGWEEDAQERILEQWSQMKMVPMTPVSYYLSRSITNAFRKVTYSYTDPRETLNKYNREINKEIARKRATLGIE